MVGRATRLAARVIAVSEATKKEILAFGPEHSGKVEVIPNGVEEKFFFEGDERNAAARRVPAPLFRLPSFEGPYVLFLGNDKPHKNLDGLLAAWAELRISRPGLSLVLAGVGPGRALPEGAKAPGFVPDAELPALVAGARLVVLPSLAEGFGLPVAEAMACGTPVAALDRGAVREVVDDGETGIIFENLEQMTNELSRVLALDRRRVRERAVARFGVERMVEQYEAVYHRLVEAHHACR
jgi:glycosyltransferase involved in cell wall biosynthesis